MNILKKVFKWLRGLTRPSEEKIQDDSGSSYEGEFHLEADKYYKVKGDYLLYVGKDMMFLTNSRIGGMMIVPFYNEDDADMQSEYNGDGTRDSIEADEDLFFEDFQHVEGEEKGAERPSSMFTVKIDEFEEKVKYYSIATLKEVLIAAEEEEKYSHAVVLRDEIKFREKLENK